MFYKPSKIEVQSNIISFFSFLPILLLALLSYHTQANCQSADSTSSFILKGKTLNNAGKSISGVSLELKKNDIVVSKFESSKNGKFFLEMGISINNPDNEFILHVLKDGMTSKTLSINTYIPKEVYINHNYDQYDFFLEIIMHENLLNKKIVTKHSGVIKWNSEKNKFLLADIYSKVSPKEQENTNISIPTQPLTDIDPPLLPFQTENETEIDNTNHISSDANIPSSNNDITLPKKTNPVIDTNTIIFINKRSNWIDTDSFDPALKYNINIEKKILQNKKKKELTERGKNASAKYETINILTSLLNTVDKFQKK